MTKSKKTLPATTNAEVLAAEETLQRAMVARNEADAALSAALRAVDAATHALQEARIRADDRLPRAQVCLMSWAEGRPNKLPVVIVSRTAKTITTRAPGSTEEQQWRTDHNNEWRRWPRIASGHWLELPEDSPRACMAPAATQPK